jgi:hypothetical protein
MTNSSTLRVTSVLALIVAASAGFAHAQGRAPAAPNFDAFYELGPDSLIRRGVPKGTVTGHSYSDHDPDAPRVGIGQERKRRLELGTHQELARVLNSDAHTLQALGRNAGGDRKVCMANCKFSSISSIFARS